MTLRFLIVFALILGLFSPQLEAGIFSSIAKLGKKVEAPTNTAWKSGDIDLKHLGLPDGESTKLVKVKLNANKEWQFFNPDGTPIVKSDAMKNAVLFIERAQVPRDLSRLDSIPNNNRLLVRDGEAIFELGRSPSLSLNAGQASIPVRSHQQLSNAINHFKGPWKSGPIRVLGLKDQAKDSLSLRTGVDTQRLLTNPAQLKEQTIVLAGPIKDGKIKVNGQNLSLNSLRTMSDEHDISLVVLETPRTISPKRVANRLQDIGAFDGDVSTGQFLSKLQPPGNTVQYQVSQSGRTQVAISQLPRDTNVVTQSSKESALLENLAIQTVIRSASIYRPNTERQKELDQQLPFGIPSWALGLFIVSLMPAFWAWKECKWVWNKVWPHPVLLHPDDATPWHSIVGALRFLIFLCIVLPIIGIWAAAFKLLKMVFDAIRYILERCYTFIRWFFDIGGYRKSKKS